MVSVIISAFNEEKTVGGVVASVKEHPDIAEVIVVDDGSTDATSASARSAGATVITLTENMGKASAMDAGVAAARGGIILFLDADLDGIRHEMLDRILRPVLQGQYNMYVGMHGRRSYALNKMMHFFPIIGGDRAMRREVWESVPKQYKTRFQIEIALNYFSKKLPRGMGFEVIDGVVHVTKEEKHGVALGFTRRLSMIGDILLISFRLYIIRNSLELLRKVALELLHD